MGVYTRFEFDATLKMETPKSVIDFIKYRLTRTENYEEYNKDIPFDDHSFFADERWSCYFRHPLCLQVA